MMLRRQSVSLHRRRVQRSRPIDLPGSPKTGLLSVFGLIRFVSCGGEEVGAPVGCDGVKEASDGRPQSLDGAFGSLAQGSLQLRERHLDHVVINRPSAAERMPARRVRPTIACSVKAAGTA